MQIALCSEEMENSLLKRKILDCLAEYDCYPAIDVFIDQESLLEAMNGNTYAIIMIGMDHKKGLETIRCILRKDKKNKIVWFSGDKDMVGAAYESGVTYYGIYPITKDKLIEGLNRCECFADCSDICRVHLKAEEVKMDY